MSHEPSVVLDQLSFHWPDGTAVLSQVTAALTGRIALIGRNGCGKSTLLRLIAGDLVPTGGAVRVAGEVARGSQRLFDRPDATVAELLGVAPAVTALRAIEAGSVEVADFDAVGDDWDVESRALTELSVAGLPSLGLDRPVSTLSGGEVMLVATVGLRLARRPVTLLDEPTNNLDRPSRAALRELLSAWPGTLIVVSHDRELLASLPQVAELEAGELTVFGGDYASYLEYRRQEQAAAEQAVSTARQRLRVEQRQRLEAETTLARSARKGRSDTANRRFLPAVADARKNRAEKTVGLVRGRLDDRVLRAKEEWEKESARLRRPQRISLNLPDPEVASRRRLAELHWTGGSLLIQGPERVALLGRNGVGKSRLVASLCGSGHDPALRDGWAWAVPFTERIGYLSQRLDGLVGAVEVLDAVQSAVPARAPQQIRAELASFLFGAEQVHRPVGTLSGGERFRVALARLLLADPPAQLLVLDEPTNNLDLASVDELVDALSGYHGGLLVVSHDLDFLRRLGIGTWLELIREPCGVSRIERTDPL